MSSPGRALQEFLQGFVGAWPPDPDGPRVQVVANADVTRPGWDGLTRPIRGVGDGRHVLLGVAPEHVEGVRAAVSADLRDPGAVAGINRALGVTGGVMGAGVFRWTHQAPPLPDLGVWLADDDQQMEPWLRPFNGGVLVARDHEGRYIGGVGIKAHTPSGQEVAVVTTPAARGRGVGRRLVVTATREILRRGAAPIYLHDRRNRASARVAEACGYRDRGWTIHGLWGARPITADEPDQAGSTA